jgi:cyclophilin family peptidyl-prolyl cis-trans isomerase
MGGLVVALLLLINFLGSQETTQPDRYADLLEQPVACGAEAPPEQTIERWTEPADQALDPAESVTAIVVTSCGELTLSLDPSTAPQSVNDFVFLARQGAYDGTVVDFVDPDLFVRGGDPTANGTGSFFMDGRRVTYRTPNEFPPDDFELTAGVVALSGDVATRGSSFLIVVPKQPPLSNRVNVIGTVTAGIETLEAISAVDRNAPPGSSNRTAPSDTVFIESIEIQVGESN